MEQLSSLPVGVSLKFKQPGQTPQGSEHKVAGYRDFFLLLSLLQATNAHTNEVVAVKKMSYSGKQTHEVS